MIRGNKGVMLSISVLFFASVFLLSGIQVQAQSKPRTIEIHRKKTTKVMEDFDSDQKKEKVEIKVKQLSDEKSELSIYINGKRKERVREWFEGTPIMLITDLDSEDEAKELWIGHHWQGKYIIYRVFRVGADQFVRLRDDYDSDIGTSFPLAIYDDAPIVTKGDGMISYESEYYAQGLGNYLHDVKLQIDESGIQVQGGVMKHKTSKEWKKDRPYILTKDVKLYSEFKGKKQTETLKKKTTFYLYEVRYTKASKDDEGYLVLHKPWIFVKTKDGRSGWMKLPNGNFYTTPEGALYEWG